MSLRRSVLYMPGANARAQDKARALACDAVVLDLEDAVAPDAKAAARAQVAATVRAGGFGHREVIVRLNGLDTPWGAEDLATFGPLAASLHAPAAGAPADPAAPRLDALLFPKVESAAQIRALRAQLAAHGAGAVPLWAMIETPRAVLACADIAAADAGLDALVLGTTDLVAALRARHTVARTEVLAALAHCVLVARAFDRCVLDGVHLDFRNLDSLRLACEQARDLGFDGKTLIHPDQIATANAVFGVGEAEVDHARRLLATWNEALAQGKGVAVLDGKLIEGLHVREAERVLAMAAALGEHAR
jgi:citrate lyase subunit beta/citryl-CoA lyase